MVILGIDPGLHKTGFGIIVQNKSDTTYLSSGVIITDPQQALAIRLKVIISSLMQLIKQYVPVVVSIEQVFMNTNPRSSLLLGHARGACIAACALQELAVFEYTALQIKKTVVGNGHASKIQVQTMVKYLLSLNKLPQTDAADALAAALTFIAFTRITGQSPIG
jgi:crossover junction endodeoxyribonuclease RuvC